MYSEAVALYSISNKFKKSVSFIHFGTNVKNLAKKQILIDFVRLSISYYCTEAVAPLFLILIECETVLQLQCHNKKMLRWTKCIRINHFCLLAGTFIFGPKMYEMWMISTYLGRYFRSRHFKNLSRFQFQFIYWPL